jgi:hypothetical protein
MASALSVIAVNDPAHIRSTAYPGTVCGRPARIATARPIVSPWSPTCAVAANTTSSMRAGSRPGLRSRSARTVRTAMSSARASA